MEEGESTRSWRFEAWIFAYPLNRNTVLDYFKHSEFYDRQCNNELILMQQTVDPNKIKDMIGVEYEVANDNTTDPAYFLIRKQFRDSPDSVRLLAAYYVVGIEPPSPHAPARGTVFPMPDLHSVLSFNLTTSLFYLKTGIDELAAQLLHTHPKPAPVTTTAPAAAGAAAAASVKNEPTAGASATAAGGAVKAEANANGPAPMAIDSKHAAPAAAAAAKPTAASAASAAGVKSAPAAATKPAGAAASVAAVSRAKLSALADDALSALLRG